MIAPVSLSEVVDQMECATEGFHCYLNRRTGELFGATDESVWAAEEEEEEGLPEWQQEVVAKLREVLQSADWLELPGRNGAEDYRCMQHFCLERCEGRLQEELLSAIQGRGAFRRFKDVLLRHELQEKWYEYKREQLAEEAAAWLESQGIAYRK